MTFYFYTKHRKASKKITKALEDNGHTCNTYINSDEFYKSILKIKTCPDLLLIDYLTYDHSIFNIYRYMHDIGCSIPLLFYNSPFPKDADSRLKHWIMALNLYYGHIGSLDIDSLFPPLKTIAETVETHGTKPHISLDRISRTSGFSKDEKDRTQHEALLAVYKKQLSASIFSVFEILFTNEGRAVSIPELQQLLRKRGVCAKEGTIYSAISRLRTYLDEKTSEIHILKAKEGYKIFINAETTNTIL